MLPAPAAAFAQAVGTWYDEIHNYNYSEPGAAVGYPCSAAPVAAPDAVV